MNDEQRQVFERTLIAMTEFKRTFGKDPSASFIAELYVAEHFELELLKGQTNKGYDAVSPDGLRYQITYRETNVPQVDINNFDFDYLILVTLDESYHLTGMWSVTQAQAKDIFVQREKYRKYQTTQSRIKAVGQKIV